MCYIVVEKYSLCRCRYHIHSVDMCAAYGQRSHPVEERTVLVGYYCPTHASDAVALSTLQSNAFSERTSQQPGILNSSNPGNPEPPRADPVQPVASYYRRLWDYAHLDNELTMLGHRSLHAVNLTYINNQIFKLNSAIEAAGEPKEEQLLELRILLHDQGLLLRYICTINTLLI